MVNSSAKYDHLHWILLFRSISGDFVLASPGHEWKVLSALCSAAPRLRLHLWTTAPVTSDEVGVSWDQLGAAMGSMEIGIFWYILRISLPGKST